MTIKVISKNNSLLISVSLMILFLIYTSTIYSNENTNPEKANMNLNQCINELSYEMKVYNLTPVHSCNVKSLKNAVIYDLEYGAAMDCPSGCFFMTKSFLKSQNNTYLLGESNKIENAINTFIRKINSENNTNYTKLNDFSNLEFNKFNIKDYDSNLGFDKKAFVIKHELDNNLYLNIYYRKTFDFKTKLIKNEMNKIIQQKPNDITFDEINSILIKKYPNFVYYDLETEDISISYKN